MPSTQTSSLSAHPPRPWLGAVVGAAAGTITGVISAVLFLVVDVLVLKVFDPAFDNLDVGGLTFASFIGALLGALCGLPAGAVCCAIAEASNARRLVPTLGAALGLAISSVVGGTALGIINGVYSTPGSYADRLAVISSVVVVATFCFAVGKAYVYVMDSLGSRQTQPGSLSPQPVPSPGLPVVTAHQAPPPPTDHPGLPGL